MKYYAVKSIDGKEVNKVYTDWESCKSVVNGHNCVYKSFKTLDEVKKFFNLDKKTNNLKPNATYYVDGSFLNNSIGWSWVLVKDDKIIRQLYGGVDPSENTSRNITGELKATKSAIKDAIFHNFKVIEIVHDYQGISSFIDGSFEAKTVESKEYKDFVNKCKNTYGIEIIFTKVKGHSNNKYNDVADELAKKGASLPKSSVIFHFTDAYNFLDNNYYSLINLEGNVFKCVNDGIKYYKRLCGNQSNWDDKKIDVMHNLLLCKFIQNDKLKQKLMFSRNSKLINNNYWGDDFWGVFNDKGLNILGGLLEIVRGEIDGTNT